MLDEPRVCRRRACGGRECRDQNRGPYRALTANCGLPSDERPDDVRWGNGDGYAGRGEPATLAIDKSVEQAPVGPREPDRQVRCCVVFRGPTHGLPPPASGLPATTARLTPLRRLGRAVLALVVAF